MYPSALSLAHSMLSESVSFEHVVWYVVTDPRHEGSCRGKASSVVLIGIGIV